MAQSDQSKQTDFTLRTDFQHDDDGVPPSGEVRPDAIKGIVITVIAAIIAYVLYAFYHLSLWQIKAWHYFHSLVFCGLPKRSM